MSDDATRPAGPGLVTPWGEDLGDAPLPEYPRPMLVRPQWRSLNGWWRYAVVGRRAAQGAESPVDAWQGRIRVPFAVETRASGAARPLGPDELLCYERDIAVPGQWRGGRVAVVFEAVDHACRVFADGEPIGSHTGGYCPFRVELPDTGRARVRLRIEVADATDTTDQQRGKQSLEPGGIWYTATSGIWQTVWMEPLPDRAITRVLTRTRPDLATVDVRILAEGGPRPVTITISDQEGAVVRASGTTGAPIAVRIPSARPWSPGDPHLYSLVADTGADRVESYFGVRTVAVSAPEGGGAARVLLNGAPVLVNAPLWQGYWPESGLTAPSGAAVEHDLLALKGMGFNGVRVHVKVESRRFYALADRIGMMVVQDGVSGGRAPASIRQSGLIQATGFTWPDTGRALLRRTGRATAASRRAFLEEWSRTVRLLQAHPSVVIWVPFNEGWGQFGARRVLELTRRIDPTRPVDAASGWFDQGCGDFRSRHRYVLALVAPPANDGRAFYLSEFGGHNLPVEGHLHSSGQPYGYSFHRDRASLEAALVRLYERELIPLAARGLAACTYTQVSDVESETNGLMTYDRRVTKVDPLVMRRLNHALEEGFQAPATTW